jgi:hypothetical protein
MELQPLVNQLSVSLSTALLESGTVPTDLRALLTLIDSLSVSGVSAIGADCPLTPAACMRAATLTLGVRGCVSGHHCTPRPSMIN